MPTDLKPFQTEILPSTLYAVEAGSPRSLNRSEEASVQIAPNIQVVGNSAHVYGSQTLPDSPPTNMTKMFNALLNISAFDYIPNYLYVDPVASDPSHIILTGVIAVEVV